MKGEGTVKNATTAAKATNATKVNKVTKEKFDKELLKEVCFTM